MKIMKIGGIIIACLALYFLVDYTREYHYWKRTQQETFSFIKSAVNDIKTHSRSELEDEYNELKSQLESDKHLLSTHKRVEKVA